MKVSHDNSSEFYIVECKNFWKSPAPRIRPYGYNYLIHHTLYGFPGIPGSPILGNIIFNRSLSLLSTPGLPWVAPKTTARPQEFQQYYLRTILHLAFQLYPRTSQVLGFAYRSDIRYLYRERYFLFPPHSSAEKK